MPSPIKIKPPIESFERGQKEFTLILPPTAFVDFGVVQLVRNQEVLPYLSEDVESILKALKTADGSDYRGDFSYDIMPSPLAPPSVEDNNLELRFRMDRNTAEKDNLRNLDNWELLGREIQIQRTWWTGASRSDDVANHLRPLMNRASLPADFQELFYAVAGFWQLARY